MYTSTWIDIERDFINKSESGFINLKVVNLLYKLKHIIDASGNESYICGAIKMMAIILGFVLIPIISATLGYIINPGVGLTFITAVILIFMYISVRSQPGCILESTSYWSCYNYRVNTVMVSNILCAVIFALWIGGLLATFIYTKVWLFIIPLLTSYTVYACLSTPPSNIPENNTNNTINNV